mmetsp:Transcript_6574/g.18800  ORF Transcript_6574/g.18800 Transcript_6574/m.18800 type:complete len:229 (+) Transcript_6574:1-687(+)
MHPGYSTSLQGWRTAHACNELTAADSSWHGRNHGGTEDRIVACRRRRKHHNGRLLDTAELSSQVLHDLHNLLVKLANGALKVACGKCLHERPCETSLNGSFKWQLHVPLRKTACGEATNCALREGVGALRWYSRRRNRQRGQLEEPRPAYKVLQLRVVNTATHDLREGVHDIRRAYPGHDRVRAVQDHRDGNARWQSGHHPVHLIERQKPVAARKTLGCDRRIPSILQ